MKQCPACKNTYTDETLKYCLADGNILAEVGESETQTISFQGRNQMRVDVLPDSAPPTFAPPVVPVQTAKRSALPFVLAALLGLLILVAVGIGAIFLLKPFGRNETAVITDNSENSAKKSNSSTNTQSNNTQNNNSEDKLANLERQLQEQKNQNKTNTSAPFPGSQPMPTTPNNSGSPTARVRPTSDGFLSLRTEPNIKTGTQLVKIPTGAVVKLENCEKEAVTVDGRRGRWCLISYNGETGWAFDAWLQY